MSFWSINIWFHSFTLLLTLLWDANGGEWSILLLCTQYKFLMIIKINVLFFSPLYLFFSFIFISWRLITLQYCSGFCHTLTWISHGFICIPHPDPPSHLPLHLIPLGLPSAPGPSTCLMHPTWAGDLLQKPQSSRQYSTGTKTEI